MQGAEGEVAGFGDAESGFDGLKVAHFADQHDVGVFAERGTQGAAEALRVLVNLTLIDQTILVGMDELDGIFDGDDVLVALAVDLIEHGGQGGGFAGAGGTGDQDQTARTIAEFGDYGRKIELGEGFNLKGNDAEDGGDSSALIEDVGAEAGKTLESEGKIELEIFFEAMLLDVGHYGVGQLFGVGRTQWRHIERLQVTMDTDLGRRIGGDMKIAAVEFEQPS